MENKTRFIEDLKALIACKSALSAPESGAPFGRGAREALDLFLSIARRMGFDTYDYDGYLGEVRYGEGEEFGIIGHLDVVPEGTGWDTDPYTLTEKDGKLYGRGVLDDKAPTLLCLYALEALKNSGVKFNKQIRFFVGCNEEAGWKDVEHFKSIGGKFPDWGFSPDGDFPVVYAEKGPNAIIFEFPYSGAFKGFKGGTVVNAVCSNAEVEGEINEALLADYGLTHDGNKIISKGKAAHGSMPELGKNAILPILKYMQALGENVGDIIENLFDDKLGITKQGNETGLATLSPDLIRQEDGKLVITADFRVPARMKAEDFYKYFDAMGVKYTFLKNRDPLYVPKDSEVVKKLMKAYNDVTGENLEPISQRGATFSSVFRCGTAFGPEFPGRISSIHEPNEYMLASDIDLMYKIYYRGIKSVIED